MKSDKEIFNNAKQLHQSGKIEEAQKSSQAMIVMIHSYFFIINEKMCLSYYLDCWRF